MKVKWFSSTRKSEAIPALIPVICSVSAIVEGANVSDGMLPEKRQFRTRHPLCGCAPLPLKASMSVVGEYVGASKKPGESKIQLSTRQFSLLCVKSDGAS